MKNGIRLAVGVLSALAVMGCAGKERAKVDAGDVKDAAGSGKYLFEDQIFPGMNGYGLTVMNGGKIERFGVEVIDVVRDFTPGNNAILVRCSGLGLEHSGIIAGMSGSPVYIDGKMIGAVAYGWGMAKDPIAGVQPIRQMLAIKTENIKHETQNVGGESWGAGGMLAREVSGKAGWGKLVGAMGKRAGAQEVEKSEGAGMRALCSPLMVSGMSTASMKILEQGLKGTGLVSVASGAGGATGKVGEGLGGIGRLKGGEISLVPGAAIAVPLVTGDMDMSAIGTVTEVVDGRVYAFGHAFLAEGATALPMATGYIYTVMPNVNQSFKMGTSLGAVGTLVMDEQNGVVGVMGKPPETVPVRVTVKDGAGEGKVYHYQLSPHPKLTATLLTSLLNETLTARRQFPAQFTARVTGEVTFAGVDGVKKVKLKNVGATESFQAGMTLLPVAVLVDNPFEKLRMTGLELEATIEPGNRGGTIRSVTVDRLTVAPGDEIHAVAEVERYQKGTVRVGVTLKVPADAGDGDYELLVGSSGMALMQETDYAPQRFDPQDIRGLEKAVERIVDYSADHVYMRLVMGLSGASVGGVERRNLPASRVAILASSRRTDAMPVMRVVTEEADAGMVVEGGGKTFTVHVDRRADERYFSGRKESGGGGGERGPVMDKAEASRAPSDD